MVLLNIDLKLGKNFLDFSEVVALSLEFLLRDHCFTKHELCWNCLLVVKLLVWLGDKTTEVRVSHL